VSSFAVRASFSLDSSPLLVQHFIKDLQIGLSEANRMGLALPGLALAQQLFVSVQALGAGRQATTALTLALEAMNGIKQQDKQ